MPRIVNVRKVLTAHTPPRRTPAGSPVAPSWLGFLKASGTCPSRRRHLAHEPSALHFDVQGAVPLAFVSDVVRSVEAMTIPRVGRLQLGEQRLSGQRRSNLRSQLLEQTAGRPRVDPEVVGLRAG